MAFAPPSHLMPKDDCAYRRSPLDGVSASAQRELGAPGRCHRKPRGLGAIVTFTLREGSMSSSNYRIVVIVLLVLILLIVAGVITIR
jgi:hypothetical protein